MASSASAIEALSTEELEFEMQIQTTVVLSLEDAPQDSSTPAAIHNAKQQLKNMQQTLKTRKAHEKVANPFGSGGGGGGPSTYSTPSSADYSGASSSAMPQRKRPFPYPEDDDGTSSRAKSGRATPSPQVQTGATTPLESYFADSLMDGELVDLTGTDEDINATIAGQKDIFRRLEQQKADEILARSLMDNGTPPSLESSSNIAPSAPGINAFDRILGRPSQPSALVPPATPLKSQGNSYGDGNGYGHGPGYDYGGGSSQSTYTMPGSFEVEGEGECKTEPNYDFPPLYAPAGSSTFLSPNARGSPAPMFRTDAFPSQFNQSPFPQFPTNPNISPAELARRAAFSRQEPWESPAFGVLGSTAMSGFGSTSALLPGYSHVDPYTFSPGGAFGAGPMASRPGMLHSGTYDPLQPFGSSPFGASNAMPMPSGSGLSHIIEQTNNIDWTRGVDATGRQLNDRLRAYYSDLQDDPRKTEEEIKELLANIRPDEDIPVEDRVGTPPSLRYPLYPHQQLALKWMTTCEEKKNKGGILADDMGLGKTISTLSLIVSHQASDRIKTTLIVAPVALVRQWEIEIGKKVKSVHKLSVLMAHGSGKHIMYEEMRKYDVVLTTYGKIGFEEKRYVKWIDEHPGADPVADEKLAQICPILHPKSKFYRVILDEAQCIKNVSTFSARAACRLNATYRWCLTGTPMMNGIHELYSLIKFLRIAPYNEQKEFQRMFACLSKTTRKARNASEATCERAMHALRALLRVIMLRRMKTSKLDGKPLLDLPPKTEVVNHVVFEEEERAFYQILESGARNKFNKYLRDGTVGKNYSNVLVLLLRLRQACCHPHLNLDVEYVGSNEISEDGMRALANTLQPDVVARLKTANAEGFFCPICLDATVDPTIVLPCGHNSCGECFSTLAAGAAARDLQAGEEASTLKCPECRGAINPKKVINLKTFQAVHMPELFNEGNEDAKDAKSETADDASDDSDSDSDLDSDMDEAEDADRNGDLRGFVVKDDEEDEDHDDDAGMSHVKDEDGDTLMPQSGPSKKAKKSSFKGKGKEKVKGKGKGKAKKEEVKPHMLKTLRTEAKKNLVQYKRYMKYLKKNWLPSAKVTECCNLLQTIRESGDKTIVFSQFTFLLDLLEIPVQYELKLKYRRYDGSMSRQQRDAAALDFQDPHSSTKIMLVSLKAGNAGLNLTSANHVIIMDPFWNPYVEMQAVDRAHRIGQQKPVQVHRLLVQDTVEDRIVTLQEDKRKFVDAALDEGESKQLGRLSLQDLTYLFNGNGR